MGSSRAPAPTAYGWRREAIDPDNYGRRAAAAEVEEKEPDPVGGFALWSGTSFAAPVQAGRIAQRLAERLLGGVGSDKTDERVALLREARDTAMPPGAPGT